MMVNNKRDKIKVPLPHIHTILSEKFNIQIDLKIFIKTRRVISNTTMIN